jgi:hypothetical protein
MPVQEMVKNGSTAIRGRKTGIILTMLGQEIDQLIKRKRRISFSHFPVFALRT